ncbi:MAG TPA: glucuronate isomerase [Chthoniobacteraceae bacterium]|jgi:glucuronate isomerase|nr:glucuronate isomerase [Chthoniobacteraceae bacterium]
MSFISPDFLLQSDAARTLYHSYAAPEPILDYHCHLPPDQIAADHRFADLAEVWLAGDHYKWRAMRANGVAEEYCTGSASPWEKFLAYARTAPRLIRNPLYHWTHLELKNYFGITEALNEASAKSIWEEANARLAQPEMSTRGILRASRVVAVCTTDDPADSLEHHKKMRGEAAPGTRMFPAFRPDKALTVDQPEVFNAWTERLAAAANVDCGALPSFLDALRQRHDAFHSLGARLSDHGLNVTPDADCSEAEAGRIFDAARAGRAAGAEDAEKFRSFMMLFFGRLDAARGWTKQLHLGALRNANTRMRGLLGPDTGFDSIGDWRQVQPLARYLDRLEDAGALPKLIVYNLNPADNYAICALLGNFQDGKIAGKLQFGSGWWFLDQKEAMEWQINALSNLGLLSRFVGMLTDSRSFLSYPRHEYFRRVLCNLLGADIENGLAPRDFELVGGMVRDICFRNALEFFGLEVAG